MNNPFLFLFGCIGARLLLTYFAKLQMSVMPYAAILISLGFLYIYFTGSRKTGIETGGKLIWWNYLRPFHAFMYGSYAYMALIGRTDAWQILFADTVVGLLVFLQHHYM
jgi:hypothetical protein